LQVSVGRSIASAHVAWQASLPQLTFAPAQAWGPEPHWRSHGPVGEQSMIAPWQVALFDASQRTWQA
jgi:hypothetical protein